MNQDSISVAVTRFDNLCITIANALVEKVGILGACVTASNAKKWQSACWPKLACPSEISGAVCSELFRSVRFACKSESMHAIVHFEDRTTMSMKFPVEKREIAVSVIYERRSPVSKHVKQTLSTTVTRIIQSVARPLSEEAIPAPSRSFRAK